VRAALPNGPEIDPWRIPCPSDRFQQLGNSGTMKRKYGATAWLRKSVFPRIEGRFTFDRRKAFLREATSWASHPSPGEGPSPNPSATTAADRPASPPDRSAPTDSSRIAADQVFDFIDVAGLVFPLLTDRFVSRGAAPRAVKGTQVSRCCNPGTHP
jgi:hypothetical protein